MHSTADTVRTILTKRQGLRVLALVFLFLGIYTTVVYIQEARVQRQATDSFFLGTSTPQSLKDTLHAGRATPRILSIPSIGLKADFEGALGMNEQGESEVPEGYDTVGWYRYGPTPGELGPAVVLGHVDSKEGPAVFYSLGQLTLNDTIEIKRNDGTTVVFGVTGVERAEQEDFPTERIYGNIDHAGLRLITCSGVYDRGEKRYSHNLIIYATLREILYPENIDTL